MAIKISPKSLSTATLLYLALVISVTMTVAAMLSYWRVQAIFEDLYRSDLSEYVTEQGNRQEKFFQVVDTNLEVAAQLLKNAPERKPWIA